MHEFSVGSRSSDRFPELREEHFELIQELVKALAAAQNTAGRPSRACRTPCEPELRFQPYGFRLPAPLHFYEGCRLPPSLHRMNMDRVKPPDHVQLLG